MPALKKVRIVVGENLVGEREAIDALTILDIGYKDILKADRITLNTKMQEFQNTYHYSHLVTLDFIRNSVMIGEC